MRRDRRKRTAIINYEERKQTLKKLGYGSLCFVVLLAVFAGKETIDNATPKVTANAPLPSTPTFTPAPSPPITTANRNSSNSANESTKNVGQPQTPQPLSTSRNSEKERARYVLDAR